MTRMPHRPSCTSAVKRPRDSWLCVARRLSFLASRETGTASAGRPMKATSASRQSSTKASTASESTESASRRYEAVA